MTDDKFEITGLTTQITYIYQVVYMAIYERFEDLPVWQEAERLYNASLDLLQTQKLLLGPGWRLQFEQAALSVSNNIAEGFERFTPNELRSFLVIARGSAGEVRSMVAVVVKRAELQLHVPRLQEIRKIAESCARQLGAWLQTINDPKQSRMPARRRNSVQDRTPE
jgi:four helix bundle protein